jgi:DNA-binding HxlR family transcriptional regulator
MASRNREKAVCKPEWCPVEATLEVIGGMWKVILIRELLTGTKRYSEMHRAVRGITHKMLAQQLRELEADGLLTRKVYPVVPPKVEYTLTDAGQRLAPVLEAMTVWGTAYAGRRSRTRRRLKTAAG